MMGDGELGDTSYDCQDNIQDKARSRKVRRIARGITSNIEDSKPRSCTPEQATARRKKDIDCLRTTLPAYVMWVFAKFSQTNAPEFSRFMHVDITIAAINAIHLLGICL
jgi:hypothetical protein